MRFILIYVLTVSLIKLCNGQEGSRRHRAWPEEKLKWDIDINDIYMFDKNDATDESDKSMNQMSDEMSRGRESYQGTDRYMSVGDWPKKYDLMVKKVQEYSARYINLFLHVTNLKHVQPSEVNLHKVKTINLMFSISMRDLMFLQRLSKNLSQRSVIDNFQELDQILSNGFELIGDEAAFSWFDAFQSLSFHGWVEFLTSRWFYNGIFIILVLCAVTNRFSRISLILLFNVAVISEGVYDFFYKFKEAKVVDHVNMLRMDQAACNPSEMTYWSWVENWFTDRCLDYHKKLAFSETDKVSPLECIMNAYKRHMIETPARMLGSSFNAFSGSLLDFLPPVFRWIVMTAFAVLLLASLVCIIVCLMKPRVRLTFLGWGMDFAFDNPLSQAPPLTSHVRGVADSERGNGSPVEQDHEETPTGRVDAATAAVTDADGEKDTDEGGGTEDNNSPSEVVGNAKETECHTTSDGERMKSTGNESEKAAAVMEDSSVLKDLNELKKLLSNMKASKCET